jgi:hypothetical protein
MEFKGMTLKALEDLRFAVECEILDRVGFSPASFDSFDTQIQAEELCYRHSSAPHRDFDYVEF